MGSSGGKYAKSTRKKKLKHQGGEKVSDSKGSEKKARLTPSQNQIMTGKGQRRG